MCAIKPCWGRRWRPAVRSRSCARASPCWYALPSASSCLRSGTRRRGWPAVDQRRRCARSLRPLQATASCLVFYSTLIPSVSVWTIPFLLVIRRDPIRPHVWTENFLPWDLHPWGSIGILGNPYMAKKHWPIIDCVHWLLIQFPSFIFWYLFCLDFCRGRSKHLLGGTQNLITLL